MAEGTTPEGPKAPTPPPTPPPAAAPKGGASGMAVASLVLGILGIVFSWCCAGAILSPLAVIFGWIDKRAIAEGRSSPAGSGLDTAGLVLGLIGVGLLLIFVLYFVFVIGLSSIPFLFPTQ